jgi:chromosome segregation ATPase
MTLLSITFLAAQSARVEPKSEIAQKRDTMDTATAAWRDTDRGLEKSILREDPAAASKRISEAAAKRRELDRTREVYYESLVEDARQQLQAFQSLAEYPAGAFPREGIRRSIDTQLDQLMSREASLKQELAENDRNADPARRRLIEEQIRNQLEQVAELRINLHQRKQALQSMETPEATLAAAGKALTDQTRSVIRTLETNVQQVRDEAAAWQEYYDSLGQLVKNRQKAAAQTRPKSGQKGR